MTAFERPFALVLAMLPLALAALNRFAGFGASRRASLPLDVWGSAPSGDAPWFWRVALRIRTALGAGAWMALCVAAAGPSSAADSSAFPKAGLCVVFAIDASPSMAALDLEPSRLGAAKALIEKYLDAPDGAAGASVGLVAFGGEAALVCPPTVDYKTVADRLDAVSPGALGDGTAIGQGLASALGQVLASGARSSAVILMTDGEDNAGEVHPVDVAVEFGRRGTSLVVVGVGTRGEVPIDYVDPSNGLRMTGTYRSGYDEAALTRIADAGGGTYKAAAGNAELSSLLPAFTSIAPVRDQAPGRRMNDRIPSGRYWLAACMALAALSWSIGALVLRGVA